MAASPSADAAELHRYVLQRAVAADRLQHVHVRVDEDGCGADFILFVLQPSLQAAEAVAGRLALECVGKCPVTRGWQVAYCGGTLPGLIGE
ncbi:hypothetical protein OHB13_37550 (plasmid) [Streptomyces sp. NBC_00440]|uniref:hypothetical protein n=1 Tax=unclassified Streptomyces TaxID=2593676 RepID=UPI002E1B856B|nr:hypothetical protein OG760_36905 [Streptomyces sp. NBC_00963]